MVISNILQGVIGWLVLLGFSECSPLKPMTFPKTINEYLEQRDDLLEAQKNFEGRNAKLSEDERIVDQYLGFLKWKEMELNRESGLPSSRPIEKVLPKIRSSTLYQSLAKLPKGGNLHSHESQQLSKKALFDILWSCKDFDHLYVVLPSNGSANSSKIWTLDFFVNPPADENWTKVKDSGYSKDFLLKKSNLVSIFTDNTAPYPTDSKLRWKLFSKLLFSSSSQVIDNIEVKFKYLKAMYEESMREGVIYMETRRVYGSRTLYELDFTGASNATNGKRYLNLNLTFEIDMTLDLIKQFQTENPRFVGHKTIASAFRSKSREEFRKNFDDAIKLHEMYPTFVIGFDTANEEDEGYSNLYFIENYLSGRNSIPLYLHAVETNWPDDLLSGNKEDDLLPALQNAYEVVLLQTRRVGHGKGFFKIPYLRKLLKERNVAFEVCLTSNQILGYDPDLRNHFGQLLFREGIPIVLGSDDQASFGWNDGMVLDWYAAYVGWGLNLADLKKLALNSLLYSGMTDDEKQDAVENHWKPSWNDYILEMRKRVCDRNFAEEAKSEDRFAKFNEVLPKRGPAGTKVHVFGRNFEVSICKKISCKFGVIVSEAIYLSNQHLLCKVPECPDCQTLLLPISISLDGTTFQNTTFNFTYMEMPPRQGFVSQSSRADIKSFTSYLLINMAFIKWLLHRLRFP